MDETVSIFSIIIVSIKGSSHTYGFGLVWKKKQYFKGIDSLSTGRQERKRKCTMIEHPPQTSLSLTALGNVYWSANLLINPAHESSTK